MTLVLWSILCIILHHDQNNRIRQEDIRYKKRKVSDCQGDLAKKNMNWTSPGPPTQLEIEKDKKVTLYTKAKDIAPLLV